MSGLIDNTTVQNSTYSNEGTNVMPKLDAKSYFFLEDNVYTQTSNQAFGVINEDQFRTTALLTVSNKKVISICSGQVFLQPQTGSTDKVNLILKPYRQPVNGLSVKYFIYRGLPKSEFFKSNGDVLDTGSEFINYVQSEFTGFYGEVDTETPLPRFLAAFIGYPDDNDTTQNESDLIDSYFYKISKFYQGEVEEESEFIDANKNFEFPMISAGIQLATVSGEIGLDIVLNKGDYYIENDPNPFKLDLAFARAQANILDTSSLTEEYQKRLLRENCTLFIDPSAYYGLHANGGNIQYYQQAQLIESIDNIFSVIQNFYTKNRQYIYIQGERQRTYNFYGNYIHPDSENSLCSGVTIDNLTESVFGTLGWPLLMLNNNSDFFIQLITDSNSGAVAFVKTGNLVSGNELGFIRDANLIQIPPEDENEDIDINYTKPIQISFQVSNSNALASFMQIVYKGKIFTLSEALDEEETIIYFLKDIDDIFNLVNVKSYYSPYSDLEFSSVGNNDLSLLNFPFSIERNDISAVTSMRTEDAIMISDDDYLKRITYETILFTLSRNTKQHIKLSSVSKEPVSNKMKIFDPKSNNFYFSEKPYNYKTIVFNDGGETVSGMKLENIENDIPTKKILGITETENQYLKDLIVLENLNNCTIFFNGLSDSSDESFVSPENINYKMYWIGIIAEKDLGKVNIYYPANPVKVYSLDDNIFISSNYTKYLPLFTNQAFIPDEVKVITNDE